MASFFITGEKKKRPGVYLRYENWGTPPIAGVDDGKCAAVLRSNWGPLGQVSILEKAEDISKNYGSVLVLCQWSNLRVAQGSSMQSDLVQEELAEFIP